MHALILFNAPTLDPSHADWASEAGVLESVEAISAAFQRAGIGHDRLGLTDSIAPLFESIARQRPDVVVNLCESLAGRSSGEDHVAGALDALAVPYTGSPAACLSLVRHKPRAKWLLAGAGLPTAPFILVGPEAEITEELFRDLLTLGKVIVKPAEEDASLGIDAESIVDNFDAVRRKVLDLRGRYGPVLVERFIPGREINVGVIAVPSPRALPLAEIVFRLDERHPWPIVTYDAKWSTGSAADLATQVQCPAAIEPELAARIQQIALDAFRMTNCRDYARVDLRVDPAGQVYILEVNGNPDLNSAAGLARAIKAAGLDYDEFVVQMTRQACQRGNALPPSQPCRMSEAPSTGAAPPGGDTRPGVLLRSLRSDDLERLLQILRDCGVFRPDEVDVAREILEEALKDGETGHYKVLVAEVDGRAMGWSCHGLIPMTDGSYDLYWIAVDPATQGHGVGSRLCAEIEERVRQTGGRWLIAETSSTSYYAKTRAFYLRQGYIAASEIADYYRPGDGRVIFAKRID